MKIILSRAIAQGSRNMKREKEYLISIIESSGLLLEIFNKARNLELNSYFVGAGCITQTVWNQLTGRSLTYGISDIDIVYFDDSNLSLEEEDVIIKKADKCFEDVKLPIDVKNQARVHLWYELKFGIKLRPYNSLEDAIVTWPTTATALGLRKERNDTWHLYAPFGLEDLFNLTLRPNKTLISEDIYYQKVVKWKSKWPELKVVAW